MPVSFQIVPARDLVVVTYAGVARIDETSAAFEAYARHPDFRPGQRHVFDVSRVTAVEHDFTRFLAMQGRLLEIYGQETGFDTLLTYIAPNAPGREMATLAKRSWDLIPSVVIVVRETEAEALAFLGQPETSLEELFTTVGSDG